MADRTRTIELTDAEVGVIKLALTKLELQLALHTTVAETIVKLLDKLNEPG